MLVLSGCPDFLSSCRPSPALTMEKEGPNTTRQPHWFVEWCMQSLGANIDSLKDRMDSSLAVLVFLGPLAWIQVAAVV